MFSELESRRTGAGLSERINRVLNVNRKEDDAIYWPVLGNVEDGRPVPEGFAVGGDNRVCAPAFTYVAGNFYNTLWL